MQRPLKIICFLFDTNIGGPTLRARSVYSQMMLADYDVRVAFPQGDGPAPEYMEKAGIQTKLLNISKPVLPNKLKAFVVFALTAPLSVIRIVSYLRREKPDVIHVNGAFDLLPALAGLFARVPVAWHLNDTLFGPRLSRLLGRVVRSVSTVVIAAAGRVARHYGVDNADTHVIFAPVDVERFGPRSPSGFPRPVPVLGLLANWNSVKRQDRFVEVIDRLRRQDTPVQGRIMGKFLDSQKHFWEPIVARMKADELDKVIETPGFVDDVAVAMADLDILLLTSTSEASPICVLEAMAIGVPQVVFDVGGVREMLGEGAESAGIIVPEGDIDAMAAGVDRLLQEPELYAAMARNGQQRAREHFSLQTCVAQHEAAYRAAVAKRKHP